MRSNHTQQAPSFHEKNLFFKYILVLIFTTNRSASLSIDYKFPAKNLGAASWGVDVGLIADCHNGSRNLQRILFNMKYYRTDPF